jgi:Rod binding domain-containing protein
MNSVNLTPLTPAGLSFQEPGKADDPAKIRDAAEQFEALLIGQLLRSARETSQEKGDAATEFAEQHMANCLAHSGGLGLATMIACGLKNGR